MQTMQSARPNSPGTGTEASHRLRRAARIAGAVLCWAALVKAGLWTGALVAAAARGALPI